MDTAGVSTRESEITPNEGDTHVHFICLELGCLWMVLYLEHTDRISEFIGYTSNILAITIVPTT
jgi:hypothetical protein